MTPENWLLIGVVILILDLFIKSFYLIPIGIAALAIAFLHLKIIGLHNIYVQLILFFIAAIFINLGLQFPRKWIKIFILKMKGYNIDQQIVRTIDDLKDGKIGKAKWSGVIVDVMISVDNIDKEIPKDSSVKVVKLNKTTFIVTNNRY